PPKAKDSGLGRAIINKQVKDARKTPGSGLFAADIPSTDRLKSVTQERDLDEFLNTAQLAGTDFTAERRNVKIIQQAAGSTQNPYLLSEQDEKSTVEKHVENKKKLRVPRRPPWTKSMTSLELDKQEKAAFLDWRRGLATLQDEDKLLLTPFEKNLEVWRQLWRVLERSHIVVQIVDARNPLRFRCEDLERYVRDIEGVEGEEGTGNGNRKRINLLLINKADLLTTKQRSSWADYFDSQGIHYAFYSAANAVALQEARREAAGAEIQLLSEEAATQVRLSASCHDEDVASTEDPDSDSMASDHEDSYFSAEEDPQNHRAKILSVQELEKLFLEKAPDLSEFSDSSGAPPSRLVVGLVGYPNVGKSSTINSLLGEKKVSVSSTPGKTKHFQTIHFTDTITLCDCPGLVFPQFATTKADLVCDGVLPIDQLREHTGPTALVVKRIPKDVLEATYGLTVKVQGAEEGGNGQMTAENFLIAYAIARGYMRSGQGNPDEARSARYVLKDYVNGKLLFCHPPPGISETRFNEETHQKSLLRATGKKRAPVTRVGKNADTFVPPNIPELRSEENGLPALGRGAKSQAFDYAFFESNTGATRPVIQGSNRTGEAYSRSTMFPHQNIVADDGTLLSRRRPEGIPVDGKRHKKMKRVKQRSGKGYDL
ncbi:putative LSG1-large-subunit GTPase, partial [Tricholoma matsutake]